MEWLLVLCVMLNAVFTEGNEGNQMNSIEPSDYRYCLKQIGKHVDTFEVLPVYGWDNIRNKYGGLVIALNYSECRMAADGKFLLPNDVYLIPEKETNIQEFAELITHWHNYSSTTSKSINVDAGLNYGGFGISGKFSDSYQSAKSKQVMDKSYVTRVHLRYTGYNAKLQPYAKLHPTFKKAVYKIAASIQMNRTAEQIYLSELLVRDFGTHITTSIIAGASLIQEDFVSRKFILNKEMNKHQVLAAASANFFGIFHASISHKSTTTNQMADSYDKSKTSSDIFTYGGSLYTFANFSVNDWVKNLDNNLVAVDKSGDPLYYIINSETLPDLPISIIQNLTESIKVAIEKYYEYNVYRGCMNLDAPNFSFQANVEDGTCKPPLTNLTFGGVYQICEMLASGAGDLCGKLSQPNPKTGIFTCPGGYTAVQLHTERFHKSYYYKECHHCGWWSRCCNSGIRRSSAKLITYWCAAQGKVPIDSGYLFGGVYSSHITNPMTNGKNCPDAYSARMIGSDLKVCISDDYEEGSMASLPFGGFFSCTAGNPLADNDHSSTVSANKDLMTLKEFYRKEGMYTGPKQCPKGFSQHVATIDQGCSIYYCIIAGALSPKGLPPVRRPPFVTKPDFVSVKDSVYIYNIENRTWETNSEAREWVLSGKDTGINDHSSSTGGTSNTATTASISVCVTVGCICVLFGSIVFYRKKKRFATTHSSIPEESLIGNNYGATTNSNITP